MFNRVKFAAAAMMLATCLAAGAGAQTDTTPTAQSSWTSPDGGLRFTVPTGWVREKGPKIDTSMLAVSRGDKASGAPVMHCKVTTSLVKPAEPGLTQAVMNSRIQAGAGNITLDEKRVNATGGVVIIDGFLSMTPRILAVMRTYYVHGGNLYDAYVECLRTPKPVLTMDDLKTARELFDTINVTH